MTIKTGDHIEIPKGTDLWADPYFRDIPTPTGRKMVTEVMKVTPVTIYQYEKHQGYHGRVPSNGRVLCRATKPPTGGAYYAGFPHKAAQVSDYDTEQAARDAYLKSSRNVDGIEQWLGEWRAWQAEVASCVVVEQCDFVEISKSRFVRVSDVTVVPSPVVKPKEVKVTNYQKMQPNSVWKSDVDLQPIQYDYNWYGPQGHTVTETKLTPIPAGTHFTIMGKAKQQFHPGDSKESNEDPWRKCQNAFPIEFVSATGKKVSHWVFYKLIENAEMVKGPEAVPEFVLLDTATNKFYTGNPYGYDVAQGMWTNSGLSYSDRYAKAKKFKRLSDVRAHLLIQSGYYYDLHESWGSVPDWMCQSKSFDVPDTWIIVKYDKLTKIEMERIEALDTFNRAWKLRDLTVKYGSAVRKLYSDLDKKGEIDKWSAAMFYVGKKEDTTWNSIWYEEFSDERKKEFKDMAKQFDKDAAKLVLGKTSVAIAIKDVETAVMMKLILDMSEWLLVDFKTMATVVGDE